MDKGDNGDDGSEYRTTNTKERNKGRDCTKRDNGEEKSNEENKFDMIPNVDDM